MRNMKSKQSLKIIINVLEQFRKRKRKEKEGDRKTKDVITGTWILAFF